MVIRPAPNVTNPIELRVPTANNTAPSNRVPASLRRRLLAMVYDIILVFALVFCSAMAYAAVVKQIGTDQHPMQPDIQTDQVIHELEPIDLGWGIWPFCASVGVGFYVFFWKRRRQTLGMRAWKLELESESGSDPTVLQLVARAVLATLSLLAAGFGYWYVFFNDESATLHDRLSRTRVTMPGK